MHPSGKFKALAGRNLGMGALAMVQWVVGTSNSREPKYSKPVVLVLGPLITPTLLNNTNSLDVFNFLTFAID